MTTLNSQSVTPTIGTGKDHTGSHGAVFVLELLREKHKGLTISQRESQLALTGSAQKLHGFYVSPGTTSLDGLTPTMAVKAASGSTTSAAPPVAESTAQGMASGL